MTHLTLYISDSTADVNLFLFSQYYNVDSRLLIQPYDTSIIIKVEEMLTYADEPEEILENVDCLTLKVQRLDLTFEESIMAAALSMMIAGKSDYSHA